MSVLQQGVAVKEVPAKFLVSGAHTIKGMMVVERLLGDTKMIRCGFLDTAKTIQGASRMDMKYLKKRKEILLETF